MAKDTIFFFHLLVKVKVNSIQAQRVDGGVAPTHSLLSIRRVGW